jgi:opacity protein-like surface antigen
MIPKFAAVPGFSIARSLAWMTILVAGLATLNAQQAPAAQTPAQQAPTDKPPAAQAPAQQPQAQQPQSETSSSNQEATPEETEKTRKAKLNAYKKWTFNVGGGASLTNGTTKTFVRGGGGVIAAGVARNYGKYFGLRADFQWDNLPLRSSALQAAQAPGATSHVYSFTLDPIINIPVTKAWGGYLVFGPSYFHRSGKLDSSTAIPGSACNSFYVWWGSCFNASLPVSGKFLNESLNEFGYNFGGGITRKLTPRVELYGEFRYLHGKRNNITTDLRPITIGVRW